jgi:hypothetical protein
MVLKPPPPHRAPWNSFAYQENLSARFEFHNLGYRSSEYLVVERGVAGRAGAMRAIAPSMPPQAFPRYGRWRPTPRSVPQAPAVHTCFSSTNSPKVRRREGKFATVPMKPDIFTLPRCKSSESLFSCCDSLSALVLVNCDEHVAESDMTRPQPPTPSVLCTVPKTREVGVVKPLSFPAQDTRARATCISFFPCQTATYRVTYVFPLLPAISPRVLLASRLLLRA